MFDRNFKEKEFTLPYFRASSNLGLGTASLDVACKNNKIKYLMYFNCGLAHFLSLQQRPTCYTRIEHVSLLIPSTFLHSLDPPILLTLLVFLL